MKRHWSDEELNAHWLLCEDEITLLKGKTGSGRILFCILLKHYQLTARFPSDILDISEDVIDFISHQTGVRFKGFEDIQPHKRSMRDYHREIRSFLSIRRFDADGKREFCTWAVEELFPQATGSQQMDENICRWFSEHRFELPGQKVLSRLVGLAEQTFERNLFKRITADFLPFHYKRLNALLETADGTSEFSRLRGDTGSASLASVLSTISRLTVLREIDLPKNLLSDLKPGLIERYRLRAGSEDVWKLRRHPEVRRLGLLSFYCVPREAEIIDGLVDLLISIIHKIAVRSERKVVSELVGELTKVNGKTTLLFRIAEAVDGRPDDTVRDVIFPVVGEQTITALVKEYRSDGPAYVKRIYSRICEYADDSEYFIRTRVAQSNDGSRYGRIVSIAA